MLLLDVSLSPGAPWWGALLLAAGPGVAAIVIALIQSRAKKPELALAPLEARVAVAETTLAKIDGAEREDIAALKEDVAAIGADLNRLREAVEKRWKADDQRRERAGSLAQTDRKELHDALGTLRERVAGMAGRLEGMMPHGR